MIVHLTYGKSPFLLGKLPINGYFPLLRESFPEVTVVRSGYHDIDRARLSLEESSGTRW